MAGTPNHFEGHLPLPVGERVADQNHSGVFVGLDMVIASVGGRAIHGDSEATIGPDLDVPVAQTADRSVQMSLSTILADETVIDQEAILNRAWLM